MLFPMQLHVKRDCNLNEKKKKEPIMNVYAALVTDSQQQTDPRSLISNNFHCEIEVLFQHVQVLLVLKCYDPWELNQQEKSKGKKIKS